MLLMYKLEESVAHLHEIRAQNHVHDEEESADDRVRHGYKLTVSLVTVARVAIAIEDLRQLLQIEVHYDN